MSSPATSTSDLFSSLLAARQATADKNAEAEFLAALPVRVSIWGGFLTYGVTRGKPWAKWLGGLGLGAVALEYFAARRRTALAQQAALSVSSQGGSSS